MAAEIQETANGFALAMNGKPLQTPRKQPLLLPNKTLAQAIADEWQPAAKFSPSAMPLTALAYTAIDQIAGQVEQLAEVLLAYVDTDTLSYRSSATALLARQKEQWDPVLAWAAREFGAIWQTTTGVMPVEQAQALHETLRIYLQTLGAMQLAGMCVLASGYSSLVLALAVLKKHLNVDAAFIASRLEEDAQAEQWGVDFEAQARAKRLQAEISHAGRFLSLLEGA